MTSSFCTASRCIVAVVRACEVWLKLHDSEIDRKTLQDALQRIAQLEKELSQANKRLAAAGAK